MAEAVAALPAQHDPKRENLASDVIRLAALWVAAGAFFKLFSGSPKDLPPLVRAFPYLSPVETFRSAIAIELCLVTLALFRPRTAWFFLVGMFGVFLYVLWPMVREGAESCGCFGSNVKLKPIYMFSIDATFILSILFTRPWSAIPKRPLQPLLLLPLFAVGVWAPFESGLIKTQKPPKLGTPPVGAVEAPETVGIPSGGQVTEEPDEEIIEVDPLSEQGEQEPQAETTVAEASDAEGEDEAETPNFYWFETPDWKDQVLFDIDLGNFLDLTPVPDTSHFVFYRQTCEHCAKHLEELALTPIEVPLVLVRVPEPTDTEENKVTHVLPEATLSYELPMLERGYGIETPLIMDVEGYTVTKVEAIKHDEDPNTDQGEVDEDR